MAIAGASAQPSFTKPEINASPCNFQFTLPKFSFGLSIFFKFPPFDIPIPRFRLAISCDLSKPVDVSAGLDFGGGREVKILDTSPDDDDSF